MPQKAKVIYMNIKPSNNNISAQKAISFFSTMKKMSRFAFVVLSITTLSSDGARLRVARVTPGHIY